MKRFLCAILSVLMIGSSVSAAFAAGSGEAVNLVPETEFFNSPNYVCTWNIQDWVALHDERNGVTNSKGQKVNKRDVVSDEYLFGENGWARVLYPEARSDLLFLLDDGWDLESGAGSGSSYQGGLVLHNDKFPDAKYGSTPAEKLKTLNDKMKALGWKGTGIWVCAQESSQFNKELTGEDYWRERMEWCKYAGVTYWKIDWGTNVRNIEWRRMISDLANEVYPELVIEHITGSDGVNTTSGTYRIQDVNSQGRNDLQSNVEYAAFSDVFRTYDVLDQLMVPVTFDRIGELLYSGYVEKGDAMGLINAEDEVYMAAALGLTMGVMRFQPTITEMSTASPTKEDFLNGCAVKDDNNIYYGGGTRFAETRASRRNLDEVTRAVMWQRIAPAYEINGYDTLLANEYLADDYTFIKGEAWDHRTGKITQRAPAAISRGIDLPNVSGVSDDEKPYVAASRNPNGAISIGAYGRTHSFTDISNNGGYQPSDKANVSLNIGALTGKIGIFGTYGSLTFTFDKSIEGKRILAQDLLADKATDITSKVTVDGNKLIIPGELIKEIGLSEASEGDGSEAGLVMQIGDEADFAEAPAMNERVEKWDVLNSSFEKFNYDAVNGTQYGDGVAAATGWIRTKNKDNSTVIKGGRTGEYAGIQSGASNYETAIYFRNESVPNGIYRATAYVKSSVHTRNISGDVAARFTAKECGGQEYHVDIAAMGALDEWTRIELPEIKVTNNQLQLEFYSYANANEFLMYDDVTVEPIVLEGDVTIDAKAYLDFTLSQTEYTYPVSVAGGVHIPIVSVSETIGGYKASVKQAINLPGSAVINLTNGSETKEYTINFEVSSGAYVSDMNWVESTTGWGTIVPDRSIGGNDIRVYVENAAQAFEKGLGLHANANIKVNVEGKGFTSFTALIGVDAETSSTIASVTFEVWVDGAKKYESAVMTAKQNAELISVELPADAKEVNLVVTDAGLGSNTGNLIAEDHADFADAKFIGNATLSDDDKADLTSAKKVSEEILALGDITADKADGIASARKNYDKLTDTQKSLVTVYDILLAAEEAVAGEQDKTAAAKIENMIAALAEITDADKLADAVKEARAAYEALSDSAKALVSEDSVKALKDAEKKVEESNPVDPPIEPDVPTVVKGDLNKDGKVTVSDILALKTIIMSGEIPTADKLEIADLNAPPDGKLTVSDILGIKAIIMG